MVYKNILITKPSSLGDIVLALPALTALRRSFPEAKISWLVRPEFAPLLENHPHLTEIIFFDRKLLGKAWFHCGAFGALIKLIRRLRQERFDAIFDFQGLFRTASLGWLSGGIKRFGPANARELASVFYTDKVPQDTDSIHLVDFYLKMVGATGTSDLSVEFIIPYDSEAVDSVSKQLVDQGITGNDYVVFIPGSAQRDKCWPADRFAILAEKIASKYNLPVLAVGTASEADIIENVKNKSNVPIASLAGQTSLKELIALLRTARLVVSNDTGPGHIASALGTPLVMMYSWSNPSRIAPYGRTECMVANDPYSRGDKIKSTDPRHSIEAITVEEVWQKTCEQLDSSNPKS
jgi:lipopolysaccharide heptosyltransferase I